MWGYRYEFESDLDLELFIKKKFLIEDGRDLPYTLTELSINQNTFEHFVSAYYDSGCDLFELASSIPKDLVKDYGEYNDFDPDAMHRVVEDLEQNQHGNIVIEIGERNIEKLEASIKHDIEEYIAGKPRNYGSVPRPLNWKTFKLPRHLRENPKNYYTYSLSRVIILNYLSNSYKKLNNETIAIRFNSFEDKYVDLLRTIIALEIEEFFEIVELENCRKTPTDKDDVFIRLILNMDKLKLLQTEALAIVDYLETGKCISDTKSIIKPANDIKVLKEIGHLKYLENNTFVYKDYPIPLRPGLHKLLRLFVFRYPTALESDLLLNEINSRMRVKSETITKYIISINNILKSLTGNENDVIQKNYLSNWYIEAEHLN